MGLQQPIPFNYLPELTLYYGTNLYREGPRFLPETNRELARKSENLYWYDTLTGNFAIDSGLAGGIYTPMLKLPGDSATWIPQDHFSEELTKFLTDSLKNSGEISTHFDCKEDSLCTVMMNSIDLRREFTTIINWHIMPNY